MFESTLLFVLGLVVVAVLWWRLEVGSVREREVQLWVVTAAVPVVALSMAVTFADGDPDTDVPVWWFVVLALPLVVALFVGLLRPGIVDVRALLVGVVVALVVVTAYLAAFVGAWALLDLLGAADHLTPAAFALLGVACAWGVHPLRVVLRGLVDHLLFGDRPDPLRAAGRVADSVGTDLGLALDAVREALVLPYVALRRQGATLATAGASVTHTRTFPLRLGEEVVGELIVGLRPGDLRLGADDAQALRVVGPLFAQMVSLRLSREAAVAAIEEERRRLRRDLHDGLGPTLTGVAYATDAARNLLRTDPPAAEDQLDFLRARTEEAIAEVRRLVDGLRPPALDELGLVAALAQHASGLPLPVRVQADDLPDLGAAVEVAAYRIGVEALTNVVRHAGAATATLNLAATAHALTLEVIDDGGTVTRWEPGTGISSMRERAALVGGTLTAGAGRVVATLPL